MRDSKKKTPPEKLDEAFNKMRSQLDFLVESAKYQNEMLRKLYEINNYSSNRSDQSEDRND